MALDSDEIAQVFRHEYGRCVATLVRLFGDTLLERLGRGAGAATAYDAALARATSETERGFLTQRRDQAARAPG